MYQASANFITAVKSNVRKFNWSGEINTDTPIEIEKERIVKVYPKGLVILSIVGVISILVLIFILYIKVKRKLSPIG